MNVRLTSAWAMAASVVGTTAWLTFLILKVYFTNDIEHKRLMLGLTRLEQQSQDWVTRAQMEDALAYVIKEAHRGMSNVVAKEWEIRSGVRQSLLRAPKDTTSN